MKLQFLGAAHTVTGSCFLLETDKGKVLIDCGMFQGAKRIRELNYEDFKFNPAEIDSVLLTHAHVDHCGLIPKLCKTGFKGSIYATKVTCELAQIMLPDSAHIQESDAEFINRKGQRKGVLPVKPLYTLADAAASLHQFVKVPYDEKIQIMDGIEAVYYDAGHIIGSAVIEVCVTENGLMTKLVFSGDVGQPDQPIIKNPTIIKGADYLIVESTYGDRLHQLYDKEGALADVINDTMDRGGNLIIPSFAVGRTQTLLYYIYNLWKAHRIDDVPIILDSPLAIAATKIFAHNTQEFDEEAVEMLRVDGGFPQMPQLRVCETADESRALNSSEGSSIIISASGMADAGRILHHLKHNLWRPESTVLFVGYQAEGSLGRRLLDGVKRVKVMGEEVTVKAKIYRLDGFSAHADSQQLMDWMKNIQKPNPAMVFVVHGEAASSCALKEKIEKDFCKNVYIPFYGDKAIIEGRKYEIETSTIPNVSVEKDMEEFLEMMDKDYRQLRHMLLGIVIRSPELMESVIKTVEKGWRYMKKLFNHFGI
jgi:metallo-beta-lactamase family protein